MSIELTKEAALKLVEFFREDLKPEEIEHAYLRVSIFGGACSGYQYKLEISAADLTSTDMVFSSNGVNIVTDKKCLKFISGSVIDHSNKLYGGGFVFDNPNATKVCGCNQSFDLKT